MLVSVYVLAEDAEVRLAIKSALAGFRNTIVPLLITELQKVTSDAVAQDGCSLLRSFGEVGVTGLCEMLVTHNRLFQAGARRELLNGGKDGDMTILSCLEMALGNGRNTLKEQVAIILQEFSAPQMAKDLIGLLATNNPVRLRRAGLLALKTQLTADSSIAQGDGFQMALIDALLKDSDTGVRDLALDLAEELNVDAKLPLVAKLQEVLASQPRTEVRRRVGQVAQKLNLQL